MQSCQLGTFSRSPQSAHTFPCSYFAGKQLERFRRVEGMPGHDPNDGTHYPTVHRIRRNYIPGLSGSRGAAYRYDPGSRGGGPTTASANTRCEGDWKCSLLREPKRRTHCTAPVSYTHLRAHETRHDLVCRLL